MSSCSLYKQIQVTSYSDDREMESTFSRTSLHICRRRWFVMRKQKKAIARLSLLPKWFLNSKETEAHGRYDPSFVRAFLKVFDMSAHPYTPTPAAHSCLKTDTLRDGEGSTRPPDTPPDASTASPQARVAIVSSSGLPASPPLPTARGKMQVP